MPIHESLRNLTKVYALDGEATWANTRMVRHAGTLIAVAQRTTGEFAYSVMHSTPPGDPDNPKDADRWDGQPNDLRFPVEVVTAGMEAASLDEMPVVKASGATAQPGEFVPLDKRHPQRSTTACLSEPGQPFVLRSDGVYVYLFRQGRREGRADGATRPSVLLDRFVLSGSELRPKLEQRYQRSRSKSVPQGRKDTLGHEDMDGTPFHEPTHDLVELLGEVVGGAFAVTFVPTLLPDVVNWCVFWVDLETRALRCTTISRSDDGLFDERGQVWYVSRDRAAFPEIFTTEPGTDPDGAELQQWRPTEADLDGGRQDFWVDYGDHGITTVTGLDVLVYARQRETRGGSVQSQQRLLLAVNLRTHDDQPRRLQLMDFGISADGRVANVGPGGTITMVRLDAALPTGNESIREQLAPLLRDRDHLDVHAELAHAIQQRDAVKADFDALMARQTVTLWDSEVKTGNSTNTSWKVVYPRDIAPFTAEDWDHEIELKNFTMGTSSGRWDNEIGAFTIVGDLDVELVDHDVSSSKTAEDSKTFTSSVSDLSDETAEGGNWFNRANKVILRPREALKAQMLEKQREYKRLGDEQEWIETELAGLPDGVRELTPAEVAARARELDAKIDALIAEGAWEVRLPMHNVNVDEERQLSLDAGTLTLDIADGPPLLVQNASGHVALHAVGADEHAVVLHYETTSLTTGVEQPLSEDARGLAGPRTLEVSMTLPPRGGSDAVMVVVSTNPDPLGSPEYGVGYERDHTLVAQVGTHVVEIDLDDTANAALLTEDGWVHLCVPSEPSAPVHLNGKVATVTSSKGDAPPPATSLHLYPVGPTGPAFGGTIFGYGIWKGLLSDEEAANLASGDRIDARRGRTDEDAPPPAPLPDTPARTPVEQARVGQMHWVSNRPGLAVTPGAMPISADAALTDGFADADQMTIETWVNPLVKGHSNLLSHPRYLVQLSADDEVSPVTVSYSMFGLTGALDRTVQPGAWSHLALVYTDAWGLAFDGHGHLDCGAGQTLNLTQDLTVEVTLQVTDPSTDQVILSRSAVGDRREQIAYELALKKGTLVWRYTADHGNDVVTVTEHELTGVAPKADTPTKVALTRQNVVDTEGLTTALGGEGSTDVDTSAFSAFVHTWYQDGVRKGEYKATSGEPHGSAGHLLIGCRREHAGHFSGIISDVRLWSVARDGAKVSGRPQAGAAGLVSWWRLNDRTGHHAADETDVNHATIVGATWVKDPDRSSVGLRAYVNGVRSGIREEGGPTVPAAGLPFAAFGIADQSEGTSEYGGHVEEVRLWATARTEEQVQDNLFRRLDSGYDDLLAYYDCDIDRPPVTDTDLRNTTLLLDRSGHGRDLRIRADQLEHSTAPIGVDLPIIRNALSGIPSPLQSRVGAAPAVEEYGDLQHGVAGQDIGVLKRAYSLVHGGRWELVTGFKVGDLAVEWLGQAQFDPQVIGFVEGAPPVPSENLTLDDDDSYGDAISVGMTQAASTAFAMGTSRETNTFIAASFSTAIGVNTELSAGIGAEATVAEVEASIGVSGGFEIGSGSLSEAQVGFGSALTSSSVMTLTGFWEHERAIAHEGVGRRFLPLNVGYALVQSETVDVFALRLRPSGLMVSKVVRKNPDIPRDWNILMFPINSRYTKQGSLDGQVGGDADADYPTHVRRPDDRSYYKPREAYQMKQAIERQEQVARDRHQAFLRSGSSAPDLAKRGIVNTYVWTADGGLFAETTETTDIREEVVAGSYSFSAEAGLAAEWDVTQGGLRTAGNLEVMAGGGFTTTATRAEEQEEAFGLEVEVGIDRDIFARDADDEVELDQHGDPKRVPGKVDAYRFMTFYLPPHNRNLLELANRVVDPGWLGGSDPDAVQLRGALNADKAAPWRVLHRVTFVSRIHPPEEPDPERLVAPEHHQLSSRTIASNYDLIRQIEPHLTPADTASFRALDQAIRRHLQVSPDLARSHDGADDIVALMSSYLQVWPDAG